jgi:hypothetical protein
LDRGYITVASGDRRYLEFAADLALSLREFGRAPVALLLGDELAPQLSEAHRAAFDRVLPLPAGYPAYLGKLAAPAASPYERTLYIDADCLVVGDLEALWSRIETAGFAAQGKYFGPDNAEEHHGVAVRALMARLGIPRYLKTNTGFLYFRKAPGIAVAAACMALRASAFGGAMTCDELLLGAVADAHDVVAVKRPWPMAWSGHAVLPRETRHQIVHFIGDFRVDTLAWLMMDMRRRRRAAGLPPDASTPFWMDKVMMRDGRPTDPALRFGLAP